MTEPDFGRVVNAVRETGNFETYGSRTFLGSSFLGDVGTYFRNFSYVCGGPKLLGRMPESDETDSMIRGILRESYMEAEGSFDGSRDDFVGRVQFGVREKLRPFVRGEGDMPYLGKQEASNVSRLAAMGLYELYTEANARQETAGP